MRSATKSAKIPIPLLEAVESLRRPGQPLAEYPSLNAALVGLLRYAIAFPRPHRLTVGIARLFPAEQDEIDDFLAAVARDGVDLREILPKPATAAALLSLARNPTLALQVQNARSTKSP